MSLGQVLKKHLLLRTTYQALAVDWGSKQVETSEIDTGKEGVLFQSFKVFFIKDIVEVSRSESLIRIHSQEKTDQILSFFRDSIWHFILTSQNILKGLVRIHSFERGLPREDLVDNNA